MAEVNVTYHARDEVDRVSEGCVDQQEEKYRGDCYSEQQGGRGEESHDDEESVECKARLLEIHFRIPSGRKTRTGMRIRKAAAEAICGVVKAWTRSMTTP